MGFDWQPLTTCSASKLRVVGHRSALDIVHTKQKEITFPINDLPFDCDQFFCKQDDWNTSMSDGIQIGMHKHHDLDMQNNQQFVWILSFEIVLRQMPKGIEISYSSPRRWGLPELRIRDLA